MKAVTPRVLLALPQSPMDPASGAARTLRSIAEILASSGFAVRALATSASEGADPPELATTLAALAVPHPLASRSCGRAAAQWRFTYREVRYTMLDAGPVSVRRWQASRQQQAHFDDLFGAALDEFRPHVLLTYGGQPDDLRRYRRARRAGCQLAFALFNTGYLGADFLRAADLVVTPSTYLAQRYSTALGITSISLPSPLDLTDVLAPLRRPAYVTMINPTVDKGVMFVARLAEEIGVRFPDVQLRIIPARGSARLLMVAGFAGGFDLRRHANVTIGTMTTWPRDIYATARLLLVPSVAPEASARVIAEALVNGVPPVASERGGLPENVGDGGFVLPLPSSLTRLTRRPVSPDAVQPWLEVISSLVRDQRCYQMASVRAARSGERFRPDRVGPRYVEVFTDLVRRMSREA